MSKPLRAAGYNSYNDYLKSEHWKDLRARYFKSKLPRTCKICESSRVELHHRSYKRLGHERLDDLIPLCRTHHQALHDWFKLKQQGPIGNKDNLFYITRMFVQAERRQWMIANNKLRPRPKKKRKKRR